MANYSRSCVLSVRLAPDVLQAVREQARSDGLSVSGEVASIVKQKLDRRPLDQTKPRKITGWLAHLEVPEAHQEFRAGRLAASALLKDRTQSRARSRTRR